MSEGFKIRHLGNVVDILSRLHAKALVAAGDDPEADLTFGDDDAEPLNLATRALNTFSGGKPAGDIELEGTKKEVETHGVKGTVPNAAGTAGRDNMTRGKSEIATGDRVARDTRYAFDNRGRPVRSIESIFASDNACSFSRKHSVDSVFGESDGAQRDHDISGIFGG
jgi:hypothetical protein